MPFSGALLREARESAGLTREQVAVEVERSFPSVIAWESGTTTPPTQMVERLAALLGVRLEDLFTGAHHVRR